MKEIDPLTINLPMPILTPRLELRTASIEDSQKLNESTIESLDDLKVFMPWAQVAPSLEETKEVIAGMNERLKNRTDITISIFDRQTKELLGGTGLHRFDWKIRKFEIGYWCKTSASGKGIVTEATIAMLHYAFKELKANRVEIKCDATNLASEAVMKKVGVQFEGRLRNDSLCALGKNLRDTLIYSAISLDQVPDLEVSW